MPGRTRWPAACSLQPHETYLASTQPVLLSLLFTLGACGQSVLGPVVGPGGLAVEANLAAVTLAEDCPSTEGRPTGDAAACQTPGNCPSLCQQSNLQIDLIADAGSASSVRFEIIAVRAYQSANHSQVQPLSAREPQLWVTGSYSAWDERIAPSARIKTSYKLSALAYSATSSGLRAESSTYLIEVDVRIDGVLRTLSLDGVTREPLIST